MSLLSKVKPRAQAYALDAFLAPGHWFFCRRIAIPEDLEKGEEEGFALLELENLSPFPLDHLHFGYCLDGLRRHAFVFAAYKRRFEGVDVGGWRRIDAALPDFIAALHEDLAGPKPLILVTGKALVALRYDGESSLPADFFARARETGEESSAIEEEIATFRGEVEKRFDARALRIGFANTESKWVGSTAWFGVVAADETPMARASFTRAELWKADLRDPEMVEQAKRDERQNALLWKGVGALAAIVSLLLLGEAFWGLSAGYLAMVERRNESRAARVESVETLRVTTNELLSFRESNLAPFRMIEALLPLQDWPNIIYRKFETSGPEVLVIDARSSNQNQVTEFKKRLERFGKIQSVDLSNQVNNPSGTTFTTTIRFVPGAFLEVAEVGQP